MTTIDEYFGTNAWGRSNIIDQGSLWGNLPTEIINKGYDLQYAIGEKDPVFLLNYEKQILFRWDYIPSQGAVWDKCRELGLME